MRFAMTMVTAAAATMLGVGTAAAAPMPVAPLSAPQARVQPAVEVGPPPKLELVRGGCGWGAHRTFRGWCHYNHGWRGRIRARHHWWHHRRWWHHGRWWHHRRWHHHRWLYY